MELNTNVPILKITANNKIPNCDNDNDGNNKMVVLIIIVIIMECVYNFHDILFSITNYLGYVYSVVLA